jgi:hypothetical protein
LCQGYVTDVMYTHTLSMDRLNFGTEWHLKRLDRAVIYLVNSLLRSYCSHQPMCPSQLVDLLARKSQLRAESTCTIAICDLQP